MRVLLVGSPEDRARLKLDLAGASVDVAGEFLSVAAAEASDIPSDAIVISRLTDGRVPPRSDDGEGPVEALTVRERQVLELLAEGYSNKSIGERLGISDQTVKFHLASVYGKLGAANRTEAVRRAARRGLVTL